MVDVFALNEGGVNALIRKIMNCIIMEEYAIKQEFLEAVVTYLDRASEDDEFGTEGWEHRFGVKK